MITRIGSDIRLDIYLQMPYAAVRFEKTGGEYHAFFSYTVIVRNADNTIVQSKEAERRIAVRSYEESISPRYDAYMERLIIPRGSYSVEIIAQDGLSRLRYRVMERVDAPPDDGSVPAASTMLMVNAVSYEGSSAALRPVLPDHLSMLRDSMGIFQELYHLTAGDTVIITHEYFGPDTTMREESGFLYWVPPYGVRHGSCLRDHMVRYYAGDSLFIAENDRTVQLIQLYPAPATGSTTIVRTLRSYNGSRRDSVTSSLQVYRRDPRFRSSASPGEVLEAMRYILREHEYDTLAAYAGDDRAKRIERYWDDKGGRQRQIEFEKRVSDANRLFTACMDGSRTPMGIVYIVCGAPDYVDCRGSYAENWYYAVGERTFIAQFRPVRETGSASYYELVPFSVNEAFWQYSIDRWRRRQ